MKLIFDRDTVTEAIAPAMGVVSNKNTIAAIEGFLLRTVGDDRCEITAYDLEKGMRRTVAAKVETSGCFVVNAVKFNQIVRAMPRGEVTLEIAPKTRQARIFSGDVVFEFPAMAGEEFPGLPELGGESYMRIKQSNLKELIGRTLFAAAQNDPRPALNGIFFRMDNNTLTLVGCDGNRLSVAEEVCETEHYGQTGLVTNNFIIPAKTVGELNRLISDGDDTLDMLLTRKHVIFRVGEITLFSRLIDSEYVDYNRFIPKSNRIFVSVDRVSLTESLERALLVTEDKSGGQTRSPVKLTISGNILNVSCVTALNRVSENLAIKQEGEDIEISFNCRYLLDIFRACDTETVKLSLSTPLMSMIVEPDEPEEGKSLILLVLPIRPIK